MSSKFSFLYVDIQFDASKCKLTWEKYAVQNVSCVFPIFLANTEVIFHYNSVGPWTKKHVDLLRKELDFNLPNYAFTDGGFEFRNDKLEFEMFLLIVAQKTNLF